MLITKIITLVVAAGSVASAFAGPFADSTLKQRAISTMVFPVVSRDTVCAVLGATCYSNPVSNASGSTSSNSIPDGYHELIVPAGSHFVDSGSMPGIGYYQSLDYPTYGMGSTSDIAQACGGDLSPRVIVFSGSISGQSCGGEGGLDCGGGTYNAPAHQAAVCEPIGTHSTIVKNVSNQTLTLAKSDINTYAISGSIGVTTSGANAICAAKGYLGVTPGSIASVNRGSGCSGDTVTQWNGSGWVQTSACYNTILTGEQCYK